MRGKKNRKGFTLGEMVTTVAIIGAISSIAVPNYMRVKMDVNMETVRQHLKTIQEAMNTFFNENRQFPADILNPGGTADFDGNGRVDGGDFAMWQSGFANGTAAGDADGDGDTDGNDFLIWQSQFGSSASDVAMSITASLNAIGVKGYTTDGYRPLFNFSNYDFRTCPEEELLNIAGDHCWWMNSQEIRMIPFWDGSGIAMNGMLGQYFDGAFELILSDPSLTDLERIQILAGLFQYQAYVESGYQLLFPGSYSDGALPSTMLIMRADQSGNFNRLFESVYESLRAQGISIYQSERQIEDALSARAMSGAELGTDPMQEILANPGDWQAYEFAFEFDNPPQSLTDVNNGLNSSWGSYLDYYGYLTDAMS